MNVFISWSKPMSLHVAEALRKWIPFVIQQVDCWMSRSDIEAGARWGQQLSNQLQETDFGIICITPQNLNEPWIHFEAGAISKRVASSRVIPVLFETPMTSLPQSLQQFQAVTADEHGIWGVIQSIHEALTPRLISPANLESTFKKWWPDLKLILDDIEVPADEQQKPTFNQEDAIRELLLTMRGVSRGLFSRQESSLTGGNEAVGRFVTSFRLFTAELIRLTEPLGASKGASIIDKLRALQGVGKMNDEIYAKADRVRIARNQIMNEPQIAYPGDIESIISDANDVVGYLQKLDIATGPAA